MNRRLLLRTLLATAAGAYCPGLFSAGRARIQTVLGPIPADDLGFALIHEHVLVDFGGAVVAREKRYDPEEAFRVILPYLYRLRTLSCRTLVECTPAYMGRNPLLLRRLAEASRLNILTNTGYYGAAGDKGIPPHAYNETPEQLAGRWIRERRGGIEDTGIKPAFIKTGVDSAPLSEIDAKLILAAALTHLATGLVIAAHTGSGAAARQEVEILRKAGVDPSAWIWVHAQTATDVSVILEIASLGSWISLDGIGEESAERHLSLIKALKRVGRLGQVLLSQDAGWYHVGEPGGGTYRPYDFLLVQFVPLMRKEGFTEKDIRMLLIDNPRCALVPKIRRISAAFPRRQDNANR